MERGGGEGVRERGRERGQKGERVGIYRIRVLKRQKNILSLYRLVEVGGELDGIKSGGGDYQLQIWSSLHSLRNKIS